MATGYPYSPLETIRNTIRLLKISQDFDVNDASPLSCSVVTVCLDDAPLPTYSAISYCWGTVPYKYATIIIDGTEVKLPKNAELALRYLHSQRPCTEDASEGPSSSVQPRSLVHLLWIDSICINQDDIAERSHQVSFMDQIYFKAERVLIWLGQDEAGFASASTAAIHQLLAHCRAETKDYRTFKDKVFPKPAWGISKERTFSFREHPFPEAVDWGQLQRYFRSPWYTRLWVVQEVALARRAFCYYGKHGLDMKDLATAAIWMRHCQFFRHDGWSEQTYRAGVRCAELYLYMVDVEQCRLGGKHSGSCRKGACRDGESLVRLLQHAQSRDRGEPRDKFYGVLGLAPKEEVQGLRLDYSSPLAEVFAEGTKLAIKFAESLDLLSSARNLGEENWDWYKANEWPSWLPLWHQPRITRHNTHALSSVHDANAHWKLLMHTNPRSIRTLRVAGIMADRVREVSPTIPYGSVGERPLSDIIGRLWSAFKHLMKTEVLPPGHSLESALCLTLIAGKDLTGEPITNYQLAELYAASPVALVLGHQSGAREERGHSNGQALGVAPSESRHSQDPSTHSSSQQRIQAVRSSATARETTADEGLRRFDYAWALSLACERRRFFVTEQGRMGLGPPDVQAGDEICVSILRGDNPARLSEKYADPNILCC